MANNGPISSLATRNKVIENCWNYLHENFHKLNEQNKLKVILTICGKNVPQEIQGDMNGTKVIVIHPPIKEKQSGSAIRSLPNKPTV